MLFDALSYSPWVVVPLQVFLCLKCKRLIWKLLPLLILGSAMAYFYIRFQLIEGWWDSLWYGVICGFLTIPIAACLAGWLIALVIWLCCKIKQYVCKR